jgi:magnesium transporter
MLQEFSIFEKKIAPSPNGAVKVYFNPTEDEKKFLIENYRIDEHTLNSALDDDELARMESEPDHIALIVKCPKKYSPRDEFLFRVSSLGVFLFADKMILVSNDEIELFQGKQMQVLNSHTDLMFKLINRFIFHFYDHLKIINKISDELEHKINSAMENKYLINLFTLEKSMVYYLNAINSNGVLLEKIKFNSGKFNLPIEESELLDDIIIENTQCYRQADIYSNILASLMDARVSIVSNNLNVLMKTLNLITIGIMVPTFVVSAFSMNVKIPLDDHPYAFYFVMSFAFLSVLGMLALWRYKKW